MDPDDILLETEEAMEKAYEYMTHEFASIRTGKAVQVVAFDTKERNSPAVMNDLVAFADICTVTLNGR